MLSIVLHWLLLIGAIPTLILVYLSMDYHSKILSSQRIYKYKRWIWLLIRFKKPIYSKSENPVFPRMIRKNTYPMHDKRIMFPANKGISHISFWVQITNWLLIFIFVGISIWYYFTETPNLLIMVRIIYCYTILLLFASVYAVLANHKLDNIIKERAIAKENEGENEEEKTLSKLASEEEELMLMLDRLEAEDEMQITTNNDDIQNNTQN